MITIDKAQEMLDDIAEQLPQEFYEGLNGGILLLQEAKISPYAQKKDLWIMGEYCRNVSMGNYICIYYGSFEKLYGDADEIFFKTKLEETLLHEFTHHLEALAGERGLEVWDENQLKAYFEKHKEGRRK